MAITRRNFLKGLLALSGAAVVGLPELEWAVAESGSLPSLGLARPTGRLGSLRIGEVWYALHDAQITIDRWDTDVIYAPGEVFGQWQPAAHVGGGIREWRVEAELDWDARLDLDVAAPQEFEIDTRYKGFVGIGSIMAHGLTVLDGSAPYQGIEIQGYDLLRRI